MSSRGQQRQKQKRIRKSAAEEENNEDDRISALPDALVVHILSMLPSTRDAIRTSVLSKRWKLLWTHVPNLLFFSSEFGSHVNGFGHFVTNALNSHSSSSSKIEKFLISCYFYHLSERWVSEMDSWIRYAAEGEVKDLTLDFVDGDSDFEYEREDPIETYSLPQFLHDNESLVELNIKLCDVMVGEEINWLNLKVLSIGYSNLYEDVLETVLSGSPVLESLELYKCMGFNPIVVTSQSLKRLVINEIRGNDNREEDCVLEISAPCVEDLEILGSWYEDDFHIKSIDVPSLISCNLDFDLQDVVGGMNGQRFGIFAKGIVGVVHHAKELKIGRWLLKALSTLEVESVPSIQLESEVAVLHLSGFCEDYFNGIASMLCSFHKLEKLVVHISVQEDSRPSSYRFDSGNNYWELQSQKRDFSGLLSHLKTVEIFGLGARHKTSQEALPLVEFLIKNGKVLEKAIISDVASFKAQNLLLSLARCSPGALIMFPRQFQKTISGKVGKTNNKQQQQQSLNPKKSSENRFEKI